MTDLQEKYADKIAKLLAKAESTAPAEAELLIAKAQELMTQYAIEQSMIDAARGVEREEIEQRKIYFLGNQREELAQMCSWICTLNNVLVVQWKNYPYRDENARPAVKVRTNRWTGETTTEVTHVRKATRYELTGYSSDLDRVIMLDTSLRIQALRAMNEWWETEGKADHGHDTYAHKVRIKCEFVEAFGEAVYDKMLTAHRAGEKAAKATEAKRTNTTTAEASASVDLVLRSREDSVRDFYDKRYGKLRSARSSYKSYRSSGARSAGRAAGSRADVGQTKVRGTKALGR